MKKKLIYLCCAALLASGFIGTACIGSASAAEAETIRQLSLEEAVEIMQTTGTRAEVARLNRESDQAVAEGHSETLSTLKDENSGATIASQKASNLSKEFAKTQADKNYQAEMNQIEYDTVNAYYGVLLAKDNVRIALDNLKAQQQILDNANVRFEVGVVAKKDVLSAESGVITAKSEIKEAQAALQSAEMNFNYLLGFPIMETVIFSDALKPAEYESIDLDLAIKNALGARNEIRAAEYSNEINKLLLENVGVRYPQNAAAYMKQKVAALNAEKTFKDAPSQIEIDVRNKATELENAKAALEAAEAMLGYAKEGYRLSSLSYDAGMSTLEEIQQAQLGVYKAELGVSSAISKYNLAGYAFRHAQDVGVQRITL
jgi:outer membrane protein TolC